MTADAEIVTDGKPLAGSQDFFAPARRLYRRHGFVACPPFGSYVADPNSTYLTLSL